MNGFIAFGPIPEGRRGGIVPPSPVLAPGRRSGRVPALPYPPPRPLECIANHGRQAIQGWVACSQDWAEEFAWDGPPGPGGRPRPFTPGRIVGAVRGSMYGVLDLSYIDIFTKRRIVRGWIAVI